jgi:hypothetical protein
MHRATQTLALGNMHEHIGTRGFCVASVTRKSHISSNKRTCTGKTHTQTHGCTELRQKKIKKLTHRHTCTHAHMHTCTHAQVHGHKETHTYTQTRRHAVTNNHSTHKHKFQIRRHQSTLPHFFLNRVISPAPSLSRFSTPLCLQSQGNASLVVCVNQIFS